MNQTKLPNQKNIVKNNIIFYIIFCFILPVKNIQAISLPPNITILHNLEQSKMYFNDWPGQNAEITPSSVGSKTIGNSSSWSVFIISSSSSYMCSTPDNMFNLVSNTKLSDQNTCKLISKPAINANNLDQASLLPLWKRDYNGIFSAHLIGVVSGEKTLLTINHNELGNNESGAMGGGPFAGCAFAPDIGYGILPCTPEYWWGSYNAFVTMSSMPWTQANLKNPQLIDYGPIVWPANGYVESLDNGNTWIKATDGGVRHPSSFVDNNFLYVFYSDESQGLSSEGRGPGIKVARALINNNNVDPNSFYNYYNGQWEEKSLPSGFNLDKYKTMFTQKGGKSSSLFTNEPVVLTSNTPGTKRTTKRQIHEFTSFSVAKISQTNYYLGVGFEKTKGTTLRLSKDLVNWSEPYVIPGTEFNFWSGDNPQLTPMLYPRLSNKNGDTNNIIDANEFYVIGTQTGTNFEGLNAKIVNTIKLSITLPSPSLPSDLNGDGSVNIFDYNLLLQGFGDKYDIFDYNQLIQNYGK